MRTGKSRKMREQGGGEGENDGVRGKGKKTWRRAGKKEKVCRDGYGREKVDM